MRTSFFAVQECTLEIVLVWIKKNTNNKINEKECVL